MSARCPMCGAAVTKDNTHRPFCSARCQDLDLGRWLNEEYRVSRPMNIDEYEGSVDDDASGDGQDATYRTLH